MAFNHVGGCSCPVGCCDCGSPVSYSHVFVFVENEQYRVWGMRDRGEGLKYMFSDFDRWKKAKKWLFKLGTKPWARFKKIHKVSDPVSS